MKKLLLIFLPVAFIFGCSSTKKMSYEELMEGAPAWVKQTPTDPASYHGVGFAAKAGNDNYRESARQNALAELANSISVTISASSVLNQFEYDNTYSDYYRDNIRLSTQKLLEGYELVDTWENPEQYWVYFRLSKAGYKQLQNERIRKARAASEADFAEAARMKALGNPGESLRLYIKAVEDIRDVLGEDLGIDSQTGKPYATGLFSDFATTVQAFSVRYPIEKIEVRQGALPAGGSLQGILVDASGAPAAGMPVGCKMSWMPGRSFNLRTDAGGNFRLAARPVDATGAQYLSSQLDMRTLISTATDDPVVQKLLEAITVPEFVLSVEVVPLQVFVSARLENMDRPFPASALIAGLQRLLRADGVQVATDSTEADFRIAVNAISSRGTRRNDRCSAMVQASVEVLDKSGKTHYSGTVEKVNGLGADFDTAGRDAFNALNSRIAIGIYPDIRRVLFK